MTLGPAPLFHLLGLGILRCASLVVPHSQRPEWWQEWRSELWHVRQACTPDHEFSWPAEREVAAFLSRILSRRSLSPRTLPAEPASSAPPSTDRSPTAYSSSQPFIIASLAVAALHTRRPRTVLSIPLPHRTTQHRAHSECPFHQRLRANHLRRSVSSLGKPVVSSSSATSPTTRSHPSSRPTHTTLTPL